MNILIPVSWLREYLKTDVAAKSIAKYLTASGPSVDRIEKRENDYIFDTEVTTNRSDAFSVFGIAREANAILVKNGEKSKLVPPKGIDISLEPDLSQKLKLDVMLTNPRLCPRFTAIILDNIKISPSPAFIKNRLQKVGIRPINNVVDITNYIMMELGQPMHAFDFDKVKGAKMTLRTSRAGEKITTLDGNSHKLPAGTIVIQDQSRLVDLCGIMGAENSQITRRTKRVILFVQAYDAPTIRKTTQALAFRTDAAARFEKGVDLENILPVLKRAVYLTKKYASGKIASELIDIYPTKQKQITVNLELSKLTNYLGIDIPAQNAAQILETLGTKVEVGKNSISAKIPSWRAADIHDDVDLIEEIARVWGYQNIPATLPIGQIPKLINNETKQIIELKKFLKDLGLTEVMTYSIVSSDLLKLSGTGTQNAVELQNPLTVEWQYMRTSLIPSLISVIAKNQYLKTGIKVFEIAKTYIKNGTGLPVQDLILSVLILGGDFSAVKGYAENISQSIKHPFTFIRMAKFDAAFEKEESATIKSLNTETGKVGRLKTDLISNFSVESDVYALEINLTKTFAQAASAPAFRPIPKYPPQIEDISAIFPKTTPYSEITDTIKSVSQLVKKIEEIDIFESEKIGKENKSITFRLTFQKPNGTPTQDEVKNDREKIENALNKLGAQIRK